LQPLHPRADPRKSFLQLLVAREQTTAPTSLIHGMAVA